MNTYTKLVACLVAASFAATPVAMASTHSSPKSRAEKYCRALLRKDGHKRFEKKYGKTHAMGKCVSAYEKAHSKRK